MTGKQRASKATWTDPDEAPGLTDDWFAKADLYQGEKLVRRGGRPKAATPKEAVNIRLDPDVLAHFRVLVQAGSRASTRRCGRLQG